MPGRSEGDGTVLERLRRRDEVLQVLFWLHGEGFEAETTPQGVARFVGWSEDEVRPVLEDLIGAGLAERLPDGRCGLTAGGRREGGRRFLEEFADIRARDAHGGQCSDPDCDCHGSAEAAVACIHERQGGHPS